jgi:hypothetical protein
MTDCERCQGEGMVDAVGQRVYERTAAEGASMGLLRRSSETRAAYALRVWIAQMGEAGRLPMMPHEEQGPSKRGVRCGSI